MNREMQEFFEWRAGQLAIVHLTRRDDVVVKRVVTPSGAADFLVEAVHDGASTGRVFGVRVRGLEHAVQAPDEVSGRVGELPLGELSDAPMPYCVFVFTNDDERGYFRWVREPAAVLGSPRLKTVRHPRWRALDENGMAEIVAAVNAWYDAQRQAQAA
ncbi:MAG TPA: DUF4365 domain-containing protein [Longimicrobium sp.]|nr:DUF4365 domain-containing protein [Longimicrobium sp.]